MSKMFMFRMLPFLGLLIMAPCLAETAYPPMQRPSASAYPQHYGYGGVAATPVPIPRPIYERRYPTRYGPNPIAGLPIPIPAPAPSEAPSTADPRYSGYGGVAATPVPIPRPFYQRQYPRRYGPNPVEGIPIPIPGPSIEQPTGSYPQHYGFGGQPGNVAATPDPISRPYHQRQYPKRYGPDSVGGLPIPIPAPYPRDKIAR